MWRSDGKGDDSCSLYRVQPQNSEAVPTHKGELQSSARNELSLGPMSLILLIMAVVHCTWQFVGRSG